MEVASAIFILAVIWAIYNLWDYLYRRPTIGNLSKKHIFITGCDSGFGKFTAQQLDALGCHVFAACLTEAGVAELRGVTSSRCQTLRLDVTKHESILEALKYVKERIPNEAGLWGIVNNAGIADVIGPPEFMTIPDYRRLLEVNLFGVIDVTMTFLPLIKREHGRVVNVSSVYGRYSDPLGVPYCVSKFGVEAFSDGLRRSMVPWNVRVSIIEPGFTMGTNILKSSSVKDMIARMKENTPLEAKEAYGAGYIDKCDLNKFVRSLMAKNPVKVVNGISHALVAKHPRARYVIGWDARCFFLPLGWLPERLGDWLLLKLSSYPIPSKLRN